LPLLSADDEKAVQEVLGNLNFGSGKPDPRFERNLNHLWTLMHGELPWERLRELLRLGLERQQAASAAFKNSEQAAAVLALTFDQLEPAYRRHHADLLFHLRPQDFQTPFFLGRMFEAVLEQGPPWAESERIVAGALQRLNDFLGHRPVAVLESGQQMQPYAHERFRPIPLYIAGAGVAAGPHQELIVRALELLQKTPPQFLASAYFDFGQLDELALDPRAYDHQHPMYKRTNYMFGEWDPHIIDTKGHYRRFVLRSIILEALDDWMKSVANLPHEDVLFEGAAVLAGTMLMASTISGAGPQTYDSGANLGSLLPKVARQRDAFYAQLLESLQGPLAERLRREAKQARQPFGKVRQHLNLFIANHGARQVQYSFLAYLYAKMGYPEASRQMAAVIPATSIRFECEIEWRLTAAHLHLDRGELAQAAALAPETEDLLHRGIACGGLVDPWNILGFQGNFPLFHTREDSVSDTRIEKLLMLVEGIFGLYARLLSEAAAEAQPELRSNLSSRFRNLAEYWDKFATTTVSDLPEVAGVESWESATQVADALAEWRAAGEAAGDISFWRQHVHRFESAKAYALVLESLLRKRDTVAAMGLLMQWLSQADFVGLESGTYSFHQLLLRWMRLVTPEMPPEKALPAAAKGTTGKSTKAAAEREAERTAEQFRTAWPMVSKLFDYLEANAGDYWPVPQLDTQPLGARGAGPRANADDEGRIEEDEDEAHDAEDPLYSAAYEDVVFRDSARDGQVGDTMDTGGTTYDTDLDLLGRRLEVRLKFQVTVARLWQMAAVAYAATVHQAPRTKSAKSKAAPPLLDDGQLEAILRWHERSQEVQRDLLRLMHDVWTLRIPKPSGDQDSLMEYDRQLQLKFSLLNNIIFTHVAAHEASWILLSCLPDQPAGEKTPDWEQQMVALYRSVLRGDPAEVNRQLSPLLTILAKQPLLYVPLDKGGDPQQLLATRTLQSAIRSLMAQLPRLGLFRETWHLLKTTQRMEKQSPRVGTVITEFDRLFHAAFQQSLESLLKQSETWGPENSDSDQLIEVVGTLTDFYLELWLEHSSTMRLSSMESLANNSIWGNVKEFIQAYGHDFFHAQMLTLGNVRAILHNGVEPFLEYLAENEDPLHPIKLLRDLEEGAIDRSEAESLLELIFRVTVEKFDRYLEYNTTTTQSDYGEQFFGFLDFLRVEASYERQAWNLTPLVTAHKVLVRTGKAEAAETWRMEFQMRTADIAKKHLQWLRKLEKKYGMRLPSITDLLNEQFVKPLALDRIMALVPQAMHEARQQRSLQAFKLLRKEIDQYLRTTSGSGLDVPPWLRDIENEVESAQWAETSELHASEFMVFVPVVAVPLDRLWDQFEIWQTPVKKPGRKKKP
jgi:hypothetical protein